MPKLTIFRGIPGSGKSTMARKMMEENDNLRRINKDLLREMSNKGRFSPPDEEVLNATLYFMTEAFLLSGCDVVSDNMNLADKHTQAFVQIADNINEVFEGKPEKQVTIEVIDLDIELETCLERVRLRNLSAKECKNVIIEPDTVVDIFNTWLPSGEFNPLLVDRTYLTHYSVNEKGDKELKVGNGYLP